METVTDCGDCDCCDTVETVTVETVETPVERRDTVETHSMETHYGDPVTTVDSLHCWTQVGPCVQTCLPNAPAPVNAKLFR